MFSFYIRYISMNSEHAVLALTINFQDSRSWILRIKNPAGKSQEGLVQHQSAQECKFFPGLLNQQTGFQGRGKNKRTMHSERLFGLFDTRLWWWILTFSQRHLSPNFLYVIATRSTYPRIVSEWVSQSVIALCSYPLKLGSPKFLKVKAQFSLNFVPNFKISVLTS